MSWTAGFIIACTDIDGPTEAAAIFETLFSEWQP